MPNLTTRGGLVVMVMADSELNAESLAQMMLGETTGHWDHRPLDP
jgi:hypothetical protein